ncbi:hypothetical protein ACOCG7_24815 [Paraburkholderia sp. DD10]|jgi:hypothetical protein|uniref:hypothetical protein n=1 Tax=Paraburkholderia TaxID=1822464 RepID=UPI003A078EC8
MTVTAGYLMPGETLDQAIMRNGPACGLIETSLGFEPSQEAESFASSPKDARALLTARLQADEATLTQIQADIMTHEGTLVGLRDAAALYASLVDATRKLIDPEATD